MNFAERWESAPVSADLLHQAIIRAQETGKEPKSPRLTSGIYAKSVNDRILREFLLRTAPKETP